MRDIVIPAKRVRTELLTLAVCFAISVLLNIVSIIWFHTPFYEVFTQIGYTVVISVVLYILWTGIRLAVVLVRKLLGKS